MCIRGCVCNLWRVWGVGCVCAKRTVRSTVTTSGLGTARWRQLDNPPTTSCVPAIRTTVFRVGLFLTHGPADSASRV
jgi:hypothetical protein